MSSLGYVTHILASAVADDGTVAVAYPTGTTQDSLTGTTGGSVTVNDGAYGRWPQEADGASFTFGASTVTVTNLSGVTWPAGATLRVSFGDGPRNGSYNLTLGTDSDQAAPGDHDHDGVYQPAA